MKRFGYSIIVAALLFISCSLTAFASDIYTEGYFKYQVEEESVIICGYFGSEAEVTVPSVIAGLPVSKIGKGAFMECPNVKTVNLPDTIMEIENEAIARGIQVVYNSNTDTPVQSDALEEASGADVTNDVKNKNAFSENEKEDSVSIEEAEAGLDETEMLTDDEDKKADVDENGEEEDLIRAEDFELKPKKSIVVGIVVLFLVVVIVILILRKRKCKRM